MWPRAIKLDCCGQADEHLLKPEQISRGPNHEYIVSFEGYTFVITADKLLPSNDHCSHIFFENVWMIARRQCGALSRDAGRVLLPHAARLLTTPPRTVGYAKPTQDQIERMEVREAARVISKLPEKELP
jgi:hypothetical protein